MMDRGTAEQPIALVGCGILKQELLALDRRNGWGLETWFLDSSLHIDFNKLDCSLTGKLAQLKGRKIIVLYGTCHPLMDRIIENAGSVRTVGQNCVELLLGHQLFTHELDQGAFFLMADWAIRWNTVIATCLGESDEGIRAMLQEERKYLMGLRTGCTVDFSAEAADISRRMGLPLKWMDVDLVHLELRINECISQLRDGTGG